MANLTSRLGTLQLGLGRLGFHGSTAASGPQSVLPGSISSPRAFYDPVVAGPITFTSALASPRAFYSPNVIGPIVPVTIASPRNLYSPDVAGAITTTVPIPSLRAFYSPTVNLIQSVAPSVIDSPRAFYAPRVANVITISPSPISSPRAFYDPVVAGAPQFISLLSIPSPRRFYLPSVTGGEGGLFVYLSNVDRTQYLAQGESTFQIQSQTIGRWQATFDLVSHNGLAFVPVLGQTVLVTDYGRRIFAGCMSSIKYDRYVYQDKQVVFHCTATDKSAICDRRVITGKTYAANDSQGNAVSVYNVIQDIASNFLVGEGISLAGVPNDGSLGNLGSDMPCNFTTLTQVFDTIARLSGTVWWIDSYSVLYFSSLANLPAAPFSVTETSGNWRAASGAFGLQVEMTTANYYNKLYAVSNLNIVPGSGAGGGGGTAGTGNTETFVMTAGSPGTGPVDGNNIPQSIITSTGIGSIISVTVNGDAQTVYDFVNNYQGQTRTGLSDYLWVFAAGNNQISWTYEPPSGATVVVVYVPGTGSGASLAQYGTALNPLNPSGDPLGTCGSGLYEGVIQVQDISSQSDLNAIALAELNRIGGVPTVVSYETDEPGLRVGQLQNVNVPLSGVTNKNVLITQLSGMYVPGAALGKNRDSSFRWQVQGNSNLDPGNWVTWYERLIARTQNPLPVLQSDPYTFVLAPGGSLAAGVSLTNPAIVGRTGLLMALLLAAGGPPVDETLSLTVTRNGLAIATVSMPATTAANQLITLLVPSTQQLYLYANDVLNVSASYQVTGPGPVPAGSVTLKLMVSV